MPRPPSGRLVALFAVLTLALGGVATRLVLLQVRDGRAYGSLAAEQRVRRITLPAERGTLYDRSMHELALSLPARAVYADPALIRNPSAVAERLAPVLDVPSARLIDALRSESRFEYLARRVDLDRAAEVEALGIPGIGLLEEPRREYPGGALAAQVLGFVGVDGTGLAGLELQYEDVLAGRPGELVVEQDPDGLAIPQGLRRTVHPRRGRDLVLTLDRDVQFHAERALADAIRRNGAIGGTVIVLDPATGEVLGMATRPGFDANEFSTARPAATRNRGVTDVYEPGSVNKVITAAAALEEGVITPHEPMWVPSKIAVADGVFHEAHPHPPMAMTITDVIAQSSNVGTIMIADRVGSVRLDAYLRAFGFGRETGIGFPGESDGILMPEDEWWGTSMATIPIGQGIAVTPLQMASVYATIANDGVRVAPRLVKATVRADGITDAAPVPEGDRVVSRRTARLLTGMLAEAVGKGTGHEAQIPGYWVAGKTGTARKPLEGALGYSDQYVASFIGFAPARDPAVVVAAILDEPDTVYGGVASAPLFREVAEFALAHLRVPTAERPR
ncbi:MAG TPA: penicillin-binding protein 2, partial [Actinomycetota bacterium]|nr:penicillin-binding protein 2 [Actinomycetota bacterium]